MYNSHSEQNGQDDGVAKDDGPIAVIGGLINLADIRTAR
jgi:hypothetical protein